MLGIRLGIALQHDHVSIPDPSRVAIRPCSLMNPDSFVRYLDS